MIDVNEYTEKLVALCRAVFGDRLLYAGLQGSYMRGEATEESDVDIMIVLDSLSAEDMDAYRAVLREIGNEDKACGFICGREEITRWNPPEASQLRFTTRDLFGTLEDLLPRATRRDEINYVKLSLGNLYHEICHRYIHADREENVNKFRRTCKSLFFIIQILHRLESGHFAVTKKELARQVSEEDRQVLALAELPDGFDFDRAFAVLFSWCRNAFMRTDRIGEKDLMYNIRYQPNPGHTAKTGPDCAGAVVKKIGMGEY